MLDTDHDPVTFTRKPLDVLIAGSGCGGSLLAWILASQGMRVAMIDPQPHPRFAIGESSTPVADMILADLAARYRLPKLAPLAQYGTWCQVYPQLRRGRKRGFSYFFHAPGKAFQPSPSHTTELLVAASSDDFHCDTHWYRADVDAFLAEAAVEAGAGCIAPATPRQCRYARDRWQVVVETPAGDLAFRSRFLVDASAGRFGTRFLQAGDRTDLLLSRSGAVYTHLRNVRPWRALLENWGAHCQDHPFDCDAAALHHVFPGGWMWQLRFDHGVTSLGVACESSPAALPGAGGCEKIRSFLAQYPSIAAQCEQAQLVDPPGGWVIVERLQRRAARATGTAWAALPSAFAFIDPLHSTGIAHTLSGVERLARILLSTGTDSTQVEQLEQYERQLVSEVALVDELVSAAYANTGNFSRFIAATMLYFTAAIQYECRRKQGLQEQAFLCADDPELFHRLRAACCYLRETASRSDANQRESIENGWDRVRQWIEPYNTVGLLDRDMRNMYRHTVAR